MEDLRVFPNRSLNLDMPDGVQLGVQGFEGVWFWIQKECSCKARHFIIGIKSCPHGPCPKWQPQPFQYSSEFTLYHKDCWVIVHCEVCHQCRLCKWVHQGLIVAAKGVLWGNELTNGTPYDPGLHKECEERLPDWKSTSHRHLGGHASYSGQKQFVQTERGTVWLAFKVLKFV